MRIYLITNNVTGKMYVGMTASSLKKRWSSHRVAATREIRTPLAQAIRKYGPDNFSIVQIAEASSRAELQEMEKAEIARRETLTPKGYNVTAGGDGQAPGFQFTASSKRKIGTKARSWWASMTPEQRAEQGRKISAAKKGKPRRKTGTNSLKGTSRPPEFKAAVSAGMKRMCAALPPGEMSRRSRCRKLCKKPLTEAVTAS